MDEAPRNGRLHSQAGRRAAQDVLVSVVLAALSLVSLWSPPPFVDFDFREPDALGVVLSLAAASCVAFRSRWPEAAVLASLAATLPLAQLGYNQTIGGTATLLALYSVAVSRSRRTSAALAGVAVLAVGTVLITGPLEPTPGDWLANVFVIAAAWVIGRSVRLRRSHNAQVAARNLARAEAREAQNRALLVEERSRTAREMQDLVAHNLTEISVQVAAARRLMAHGDVSAAHELLLEVEQAGRSAMDEMRRVVGMLGRSEADPELRPQPGIGDLDLLVERERGAGADVRLSATGSPVDVPAGVALTAYRVVEEALRQARDEGPAAAEVHVDWCGDELSVRVSCDPTRPRVCWDDEPGPASGTPLGCLRNRVETYGGELRLARTRNGGLSVAARFPTAAVRRSA